MISEMRGLGYLIGLTAWRQSLARKSIIALVLVGLYVLAVYAWSVRRVPEIMENTEHSRRSMVDEDERGDRAERRRAPKRTPEERVRVEFAEDIVMGIFMTFLAPLLSLIYATSAFGDEREDRTLVYLLTRPLGRWRIYLAKGIGVLPVVMAVVLGAFIAVCLVAGPPGREVMVRFLPGIILATVTYTALFLFFGAVAPKPLIMSVVYAFLVETLVGNMPGTLKRMAISYHGRCLLFHAGAEMGVVPANPKHLVPISSEAATMVLVIAISVLLVVGAVIFQRREYRDLA